jgi:NADH:ubiquinone oxidoreductase subunit
VGLLNEIFTWWNGQTLGTRFHTWRKGKLVGTDDAGNTFYQSSGGDRRWVIYNGEAEASRIAPEWHGWLHHTWQEPPTRQQPLHRSWQKPHQPNPTGTDAAYRPPGSILVKKPRPAATDYEPWSPA